MLNEWIVKIKRDLHEKYIKSSDPNELEEYKDELESLFHRIYKAKGNKDLLKKTGLPDQIIEDMSNVNEENDIIDTLNQAFTVYHFNRSPKHQEELNQQIGGLR